MMEEFRSEASEFPHLVCCRAGGGFPACPSQPSLSHRTGPSHLLCDWARAVARSIALSRPLGQQAARNLLYLCAHRKDLRAGNVVRGSGGYPLAAGYFLLHFLFCPPILWARRPRPWRWSLMRAALPARVYPCRPARDLLDALCVRRLVPVAGNRPLTRTSTSHFPGERARMALLGGSSAGRRVWY